MGKKKVVKQEESSDSEPEVIEQPKPKKNDKRAESSRANAAKAREAKLNKLKQQKQEEKADQQTKLKEAFKLPIPKPTTSELPPVYNEPKVFPTPQYMPPNQESDDEEEILIINPPPIDEQKLRNKQVLYQNMQEVFDWVQQEKHRKAGKQPKQETLPTAPAPPVVINFPQNTPVQKEVTEEEKVLRDKLLLKCGSMPTIKF